MPLVYDLASVDVIEFGVGRETNDGIEFVGMPTDEMSNGLFAIWFNKLRKPFRSMKRSFLRRQKNMVLRKMSLRQREESMPEFLQTSILPKCCLWLRMH